MKNIIITNLMTTYNIQVQYIAIISSNVVFKTSYLLHI